MRFLIVLTYWVVVIILFCPGAGSLAEVNATAQEQLGKSTETVRLSACEVMVAVTVRDKSGKLVSGLRKEDFQLFEDGRPQRLTGFVERDVPVSVVLLLDASASVYDRLPEIRTAAWEFVQCLTTLDSVSVLQFGDRVELLQDWTQNQDVIKEALFERFHSEQKTSLYDGIYRAASIQLSGKTGRKVIVLLTDGDDTGSVLNSKHAFRSVQLAGAILYVISEVRLEARAMRQRLGSDASLFSVIVSRSESRDALLAEHVRATGGQLFSPEDEMSVRRAYLEIAGELRRQYILTYEPPNDRKGRQYRKIRVSTSIHGSHVYSRDGYYARKDSELL